MGWSWSDVAMEDVLQEMVATAGPMSVRIDANHDSFKNYRGGESRIDDNHDSFKNYRGVECSH